MVHLIKCTECEKFTENTEFCEFCNAPLNTQERRIKKIEKEHTERLSKKEEPFKVVKLLDKMKKHPNIFVKAVGYILNSVFVVIMFIVSVISYIIALIVAG